jgi:hypothetical protein
MLGETLVFSLVATLHDVGTTPAPLCDYYTVALSVVSFLYAVLPMLQTLSFTSVSQARWCHVVPSQARWPFDRIESKTGARRPSLQVVIAAAGILELNMSGQASRSDHGAFNAQAEPECDARLSARPRVSFKQSSDQMVTS